MLPGIVDFSNIYFLIGWVIAYLIINVFGIVKKHSICSLITLICSVIFLIIHTIYSEMFVNIKMNVLIDFISLGISIFMYLYVDDIEARRKVISEVFENKFKNKK